MELINIRDNQMDDHMNRDLCALFRAEWHGDEQTLVQLLRGDAAILAVIPDDGRRTPLHISTLLGHVPFTGVLLRHNRDLLIKAASAEGDSPRQYRHLTIRKDSCGRTALHLASAEGNLQIVQILLHLNKEACLDHDEEGRIPLHYAAMRGRTEVVQELIKEKPESLSRVVNGEGSTVFHLCVTYNHLETLQTLVKLDYATPNITKRDASPLIFMLPDRVGDNILHLAIMMKRVVSYLLSIPEIRKIASWENNMGFTAHDILERSPKDFRLFEIQHMLTKAFDTGVVVRHKDGYCIIFKCISYYLFKRLTHWLKHKEDSWLEEMRGHLSTVSAFIATITFQGLINPPGGFIQQGLSSSSSEENATSSSSSNEVLNNATSSSYDLLSCINILPDNHTYCPGQALASSSHLHSDFERYLFYVTISFFSSLSVTLLLVSGIFPMKNRAVIWTASIGMCITLTCLAAAYNTAINIIIPVHLLQEKLISKLKNGAISKVWGGLLQLIAVLIPGRIYVWVWLKSSSWGSEKGCRRFLSMLLRIIVFLVILLVPPLILNLVFRFYGI